MQQEAQNLTGSVQEYVGARSTTILRKKCTNKHSADELVATVKRDTGLVLFWEEEHSGGNLRFFAKNDCSAGELFAIATAAKNNEYLLH